MTRIASHIEHLLLDHDCVILPDFGGFVLQYVPATVEEGQVCPMRKEIGFNATLRHADGLLLDAYRRAYAVDAGEAQEMLTADVADLAAALRQHGRVDMGRLGGFSLGKEGQTVFTPGDSGVLRAEAYGLPAFSFPLLPVEQHLEEALEADASLRPTSQRDVFYIPVSRRLIRVAGAAAAAVALFFLATTPVKDVNPSVYRASFVPTEMMAAAETASPQAAAEEAALEVAEEATEKPEAATEATAAATTEALAAQPSTPARPEANAAAQPQKTGKKYHIVIASFPDENQANEFLSEVDRTRYANVNMVVRSGKYRIYADRFDNRTEAEAYLAQIREEAAYRDAWLFISR